MTNAELKKKIAEAPEQEWFKTISVTFPFSIVQPVSQIGLSAIYEYVNQQIDGWNSYATLPRELLQSKTYFTSIQNAISKFVNNYSQQDANVLKIHWQRDVLIHLNNSSSVNLRFPYNVPEIEFLIEVYQTTPNCFQGAYNFILGKNTSANDRNALYGAMLAYEFIRKDYTNNAEKSISKTIADFQKYLSESEQQLATHLNDANTNYADYVKKIDNLKTEKEKLFTNWFEPTTAKVEELKKTYEKKIVELEETYKEQLKLEAPAEYWSHRAKKLRKQGLIWSGVLVVLTLVVCFILYSILRNPPEIFNTSIWSEDISIAIKWILGYATLISFLAYSIRAISKMMFSSFHLARDCEERHTLTYFYLSLLEDSSVTESERQLIMQSLFSRADTGLLKDDSSPTMPTNLFKVKQS